MNIFNDSTTSALVGGRLQNIQDLNITQDSVAVLQSNNQSISRPISYYAQNTLLSLNSDADIQIIANNQSPLGYSTIYVDNIEKLAENVNQDLNLKPKAENPVNTTIGLKSGITYWGTFVANADVQPRATAKIESGFYSGDAWQKQKLRFYVGYDTYDGDGNIANYPGYDTSTLKLELDNSNHTTYVNIVPNANDTLDLGSDAGDTGNNTEGGDRWFRNAFISNIYHNNSIQVSDERLKTDIKPIPSALGSILKIDTKMYRYKSHPNKIRFGMIAQQIQTLFSDEYGIVHERENGYLGVNYLDFIPLIIKSIQELARNRKANIPDDVNVVEVPREDPRDNNMFGSIFERIMKLERLISAGANIVESVEEVISSNDNDNQTNLDDILVRLEKLENKHHHGDSDGESDGFDMVAKLQSENYELGQRITKLESKVKRVVTLVNKLTKQSN
jgi:hypothetical protein